MKANFIAQEVLKASRPKRKAPQTRGLVKKWAKEDDSDSCLPSTSTEDLSETERSNLETEDVCTGNELFGWGEDENNKATQTEFTKHELSSKIETIIVKNELKAKTSQVTVTGTSFTVFVLDVRLSAFLSRKILASSHLPLSIQESRM